MIGPPLQFPLLAAALIMSWSSGFVGIRFASDVATVPQILFGRSLFSGVILLPIALLWGPRITGRAVAEQGFYAFFGMFLYLGGFAWAIGLGVPTGLVALMADVVPLAIALLSAPILGQPLSLRQWVGTGLGLAGVALVSADAIRLGSAPLYAYALPLLGMLAFALSIVMQERRASATLSIVQRLTLQCLWAAAMFAPLAWVTDGLFPVISSDYVIGTAWLVVLATFGGWLIYYQMLRLYPPAVVLATIYLSPPVTMVWAWALWDEPLTIAMGAGLVITLAGVALVAARARQ